MAIQVVKSGNFMMSTSRCFATCEVQRLVMNVLLHIIIAEIASVLEVTYTTVALILVCN